jgi:UDP-2,3-diacylglucosamine hydrolase
LGLFFLVFFRVLFALLFGSRYTFVVIHWVLYMAYTLFISDLHLHAEQPQQIEAFCRFVRQHQGRADGLYILGDWFNVWYGDDCVPHWVEPLVRVLLAASYSMPIYVMRGNRDVLLGPDFCASFGGVFLEDPTVIELYGRRVLLTHGDYLCRSDWGHLLMRHCFDSVWVQKLFTGCPLSWRLSFANAIRSSSKKRGLRKTAAKKSGLRVAADLCPHAVMQWLQKHKASHLIHGHTHRPAFIQLGDVRKRITLGSWDHSGFSLLVDDVWQARLASYNFVTRATHLFACSE